MCYRSVMVACVLAAAFGCNKVGTNPTAPLVRSAQQSGPKITPEAIDGSWKAPGGGSYKEIFAYFGKDGKGWIRGAFAGAGGIRWEFTFEIDTAENVVKIAQEGKSQGTARLTDDSKLHIKIPGNVVIGDECEFTRDTK